MFNTTFEIKNGNVYKISTDNESGIHIEESLGGTFRLRIESSKRVIKVNEVIDIEVYAEHFDLDQKEFVVNDSLREGKVTISGDISGEVQFNMGIASFQFSSQETGKFVILVNFSDMTHYLEVVVE